jgi:F420-non-reducing hydrogenase small subunit
MARPKLALYWCSSCGGCEASILDLAEDLLEIVEQVEIAFWPVALDFKRDDLLALPDRTLDASFINGAIRTDEDAEMASLLRRKSGLVFAHGACAHLGGVVGLADFHGPSALLERVYRAAESVNNPDGIVPGALQDPADSEPRLPRLRPRVSPLADVVEVDYYIPGCPPPPELMQQALQSLIHRELPPKGSVFGDAKALCHSCPRGQTLVEGPQLPGFQRIQHVEWDDLRCFLPQGIVCLGPATRGGCEARCIAANMPCRGCFGPVAPGSDPGGSAAAFLASLIDPSAPSDALEAVNAVPDPAGLFYRYSLPVSLLGGCPKIGNLARKRGSDDAANRQP